MYVAGRRKSLGRGRGRGWLIPAEGETLPCLSTGSSDDWCSTVHYSAAATTTAIHAAPY